MKNLLNQLCTKFSTSTLLLAFLSIAVISCGNSSTASNKKVLTIKSSKIDVETTEGNSDLSLGDPIADIEKARKNGQAVFIVVTGKSATGIENAVKVAKEASVKSKNSVVIKLDRDLAANKSLVTKYGIGSVQLPFILVVSPKGIAVGGYPSSQATADLLVKAIPSPKHDETLYAISQKQPVFIVISKAGLKDKASILTNCKSASSKLTPTAVIVEVDFADTKEANFIKQMGITAITDQTITVVANGSGQITDTFKGIQTSEALVNSVKKVIKSGGCAPGGCGSGKKC